MSRASSHPVPPQAPGPWQDQLRQLVQELRQFRQTQQAQGIYRAIVAHGLIAAQHGVTPEAYRHRLQSAGLKPSRASELVTILKHPEAAADFTRAQTPIGIRLALKRARISEPQPPAPAATARTRGHTQLAKLAPVLIASFSAEHAGAIECGLFRLRFISGPPTPKPPCDPNPVVPQATVVSVGIPLFPDAEEKLAHLALRSGLSRAETAVLLLQRAPWSALFAAIPPQSATPDSPAPAPRPAPRQKPAPMFSLHRRKHPVRTPADVCRLAVKMSADLAARLTRLGQGCGRSRPETATLLLEPAPLERLAALAAARAAARQERGEPPTPLAS